MRKVDIYIEVTTGNYSKIELYNDEDININSSIQNVQDLAKVYTDFTQSFTIPASPNNNKIFEYFYESSVVGRDHNVRRDAFIEIQTIPFRSGKIQLEKANVVNNRVESYSITFYGDLMSLKDKFGDDTLSDLSLSSYGTTYTGTVVRTRLVNPSVSDIRFPLISSRRQWTYGGGANTDISDSRYPIVYDELFPALRVKKIFEAIQTKYGITFNSLFFNQNLFTELFLLLKNRKSFKEVFSTEVNFLSGGVQVPSTATYNATNNTMIKVSGTFTIKVTELSVKRYFLDVYLDDKFITTYSAFTSVGSGGVPDVFPLANSSGNYKFRLRSNDPLTSANVLIVVQGGSGISSNTYINCSSITSTNFLNPTDHVPNIKISDFVSGVLKMFNMTCYAKSINVFQVEPLDDWYSQGGIVNITKYVTTDEIEIERHKLYKEISFNYEESESFINKEYNSRFDREFGSLDQSFPNYDGGEYKIELPFENIEFTKETITNALEPPKAYLLDSDSATESYDNKPILLYLDSQKSTSFYFSDGTTTAIVNNYMPLTNQLTFNGADYSNHFSNEGSAFTGVSITNTLYSQYYGSYLSNLFNKQNRLTKVKALFPISLITSLKLNDRLIIRDKRYIINEMKCNLTNGEVDLELINDFRPIQNFNLPVVPPSGGVVQVGAFLGNNKTAAGFEYPGSGGVVTLTADTLLDITIPANTSGFSTYSNIYRDYEVYATIYQDA